MAQGDEEVDEVVVEEGMRVLLFYYTCLLSTVWMI